MRVGHEEATMLRKLNRKFPNWRSHFEDIETAYRALFSDREDGDPRELNFDTLSFEGDSGYNDEE